jgi:hypothetical protein
VLAPAAPGLHITNGTAEQTATTLGSAWGGCNVVLCNTGYARSGSVQGDTGRLQLQTARLGRPWVCACRHHPSHVGAVGASAARGEISARAASLGAHAQVTDCRWTPRDAVHHDRRTREPRAPRPATSRRWGGGGGADPCTSARRSGRAAFGRAEPPSPTSSRPQAWWRWRRWRLVRGGVYAAASAPTRMEQRRARGIEPGDQRRQRTPRRHADHGGFGGSGMNGSSGALKAQGGSLGVRRDRSAITTSHTNNYGGGVECARAATRRRRGGGGSYSAAGRWRGGRTKCAGRGNLEHVLRHPHTAARARVVISYRSRRNTSSPLSRRWTRRDVAAAQRWLLRTKCSAPRSGDRREADGPQRPEPSCTRPKITVGCMVGRTARHAWSSSEISGDVRPQRPSRVTCGVAVDVQARVLGDAEGLTLLRVKTSGVRRVERQARTSSSSI